MRSRRWRRSSHPLTTLIDTAVNARQASGLPITTGAIVNDVMSAVKASTMFATYASMLGPRVRARLVARGLRVVDDTTWVRETDVAVDNVDFATAIAVKVAHINHVRRWLKADQDVQKFLNRMAARLGRNVTVGEFEKQVDAIYERHGLRG